MLIAWVGRKRLVFEVMDVPVLFFEDGEVASAPVDGNRARLFFGFCREVAENPVDFLVGEEVVGHFKCPEVEQCAQGNGLQRVAVASQLFEVGVSCQIQRGKLVVGTPEQAQLQTRGEIQRGEPVGVAPHVAQLALLAQENLRQIVVSAREAVQDRTFAGVDGDEVVARTLDDYPKSVIRKYVFPWLCL